MAIPPTAPVPTIDATGIHIPDFNDVLTYFKDGYRGIYGNDVYLENDSQDGQLMSLFALAVDDVNSAIVASYNAYSPSTAQGVGLSSNVKINGIHRQLPTYSSVDLYIVGVAGTIITNGYATGADNVAQWLLPATVTIGSGGDVTATAVCATVGTVRAEPGTITSIGTPTLGWQTVTNPAAATAGAPVETDAALRFRQSKSTMLPSLTVLDGIEGAIWAIPGVQHVRIYENDTDVPVLFNSVSTAFPAHSISAVVDGGDDTLIASAIGLKKTPGSYTNGTTAVPFTSAYGVPQTIRFSRPVVPSISFNIVLTAFTGFTTLIQAQIANTLAAWTNALGIGIGSMGKLEWIAALVPAQLYGTPNSYAYEITSLQVGVTGGSLGTVDLLFPFDNSPFCDPANVTFTVNPSTFGARRGLSPLMRR